MQLMYYGKLDYKEDQEDKDQDGESVVSSALLDIEDKKFQTDYEHFLNHTRNDLVDVEIKEYLSKEGFGTMKTENSLSSQLLSTGN